MVYKLDLKNLFIYILAKARVWTIREVAIDIVKLKETLFSHPGKSACA